jgi:hypothetical protein
MHIMKGAKLVLLMTLSVGGMLHNQHMGRTYLALQKYKYICFLR